MGADSAARLRHTSIDTNTSPDPNPNLPSLSPNPNPDPDPNPDQALLPHDGEVVAMLLDWSHESTSPPTMAAKAGRGL